MHRPRRQDCTSDLGRIVPPLATPIQKLIRRTGWVRAMGGSAPLRMLRFRMYGLSVMNHWLTLLPLPAPLLQLERRLQAQVLSAPYQSMPTALLVPATSGGLGYYSPLCRMRRFRRRSILGSGPPSSTIFSGGGRRPTRSTTSGSLICAARSRRTRPLRSHT